MSKEKQSNLKSIIQMEYKVFQKSGLINYGVFDSLTNEFMGVRIIAINSCIEKIEKEENVILQKLNVEDYLELITRKNLSVKGDESGKYDVKFFGRRMQ